MTKDEAKQVEALVEKYGLDKQGMSVYDTSSGERVKVATLQRDSTGSYGNGIYRSGQDVYQKDDGSWTADPVDVSKFTLTENGIELVAPKSLTSTPEFAQIFGDNSTLKSINRAYIDNKDTRVPYMQLKADGTTEETQITVPELVEKWNTSLNQFIDTYKAAENNREILRSKYGDKVNNLSLMQIGQIQSSGKDSDRIYLPDFIFDFNSSFKSLENLRDEFGTVSKEDFGKVYNLSNTNAEELAGILASIEGRLSGSDWGEEEIEYEDGTTSKNPNSASEAAKALALKQYILSVDPNGKWYQEIGEGAVTAIVSAAEGVTSFFANELAFVRDIAPWDSGAGVAQWTEEMQNTTATWVEQRALTQDSAFLINTLGQIGGMVGAGIAQSMVAGAAAQGVRSAYATAVGEYATNARAVANMGPSAQADLSAESLAAITNLENVSTGAKLAYKVLPLAQKVQVATNVAKTFMESHKVLSWTTGLLLDTFHDAIVYDYSTLRKVMTETDDENARAYWMTQLIDNSKWWVGVGVVRSGLKYVNSTGFGQLVNARVSQGVNKLLVEVGDKKQAIKDQIYGGDVIRHLENQIENTKDGAKKNRLISKLEQTELNANAREARRAFAYMDLEREGLHLSGESLDAYHKATTAIREWELAIDNYRHGTVQKTVEMVGTIKDPATGKQIFVNPDLGISNVSATKTWEKLQSLSTKYGLSVSKGATIGQDLIDYVVGTQHLAIMEAISSASGEYAEAATNAAEVIRANLKNVSAKLPEGLLAELQVSEVLESYTGFYRQLNEYGIAKGLVDSNTIKSYMENPIWKANGYMPIEVDRYVAGKWVEADGRYKAIVQDDIEHFSYNVEVGQHYKDPEIVRQQRLRSMARAELNQEMATAYQNVQGATNKVQFGGAETARAKQFAESKRSLQKAIDEFALGVQGLSKGVADTVEITPGRVDDTALRVISDADAEQGISALSLQETAQILRDNGVFVLSGEKRFSDMVTERNYGTWYEGQSDSVKTYLKNYYEEMGYPTYTDDANSFTVFSEAVKNGGDDFEAGLQRAYLLGDEEFRRSGLLQEISSNVSGGNDPYYRGEIVAKAKDELTDLIPDFDGVKFVDDVERELETAVDNYVGGVLSDTGARKALDAMYNSSNGASVGGKYYVLDKLRKNSKAKKKFVDACVKNVESMGLKGYEERAIRAQVGKLWDEYLNSATSSARSAAQTIYSGLIDSEVLYKEVSREVQRIQDADKPQRVVAGGKEKDSLGKERFVFREESAVKDAQEMREHTVVFLDSKGRQSYVEVDPNFASLYKYRYQMSDAEAGAMARFNAATSKLFRFGTTTLNLTSFGNQLFRDTGNALIVGGAWDTIKHNADNLVDVFGENIVEQIKNFDPTGYEMKQVEAIAKQTGQTVEEAAVSRELARGAALSPATTESELYKTFMKQAYGDDNDGMLSNLRDKIDSVTDRVDDLANGRREKYLRKRVFANNLNQALEQGYTLQQARVFANFAMNNATTNFARQTYHMQAISDSVPYFRAAINGTKSFWRMWSLDPVGISGRMMGGLILPAIFLTGASLNDAKDRELYMNIPEYQKKDNLTFVVRGGVLSIPIPQEMAKIVAPFRQFTEYLWTANKNDFWELLGNDVLGLSPIDLTGFSAIDMNTIGHDPTVLDRVGRGTARVFSQVAPVAVKSAYIMATGIDPYTGKKVTNPTYTYWDDSTESLQTMDYTQTSFAKAFSSIFGKEVNAALAEKVVSGVIGSTGVNVLGEIAAIFTEGWGEAAARLGEDLYSQAVNPYTVNIYELSDSAWRQGVKELEAEKEKITSSDKWQTIYSKLSQTTDEEERKKLVAQGQNLVNAYQQKVVEMVKRLDSEYGGTLDRKKFGAVINLLNFNSDPMYQSGTLYSSNVASDAYYEGRDMAVSTMQALGIYGTEDYSIFGYLAKDQDGNTVMKYSSPTAIMETQNAWYGAADIDQANIEAKLKTDGIKTSDMWNGYYAAKAQGKTALKQYKSEWNAKVVKSLAPYISERGVDNALRNSGTRDLLEKYLLIDNRYQVKQYLYKIFGES